MGDVAKLEKNLSKLTQEGAETSKILNVSERLLSLQPDHDLALRCKTVCCMHNEKFGSSLATLEQLENTYARNERDKMPLSTTVSAEIVFQRGYCLYRMRRYAEAKGILTSGMPEAAGVEHLPSLHLLAQLHYNLEEYEDAAAIYATLLERNAYYDTQAKVELLTNYTAALACCQPKKAVEVMQCADVRNSDLAYNAAMALIEAQEFDAAMIALQQAEALCMKERHPTSQIKTLQEALGLSEKERASLLGVDAGTNPERCFFNDVANIWVQMAYLKCVQRCVEEARRILDLVLFCKPSSAVIAALAAINWTAVRPQGDFVDSIRKLHSAQHERVSSRLTSKQLFVVRYNMALLHINAGSFNSSRKLVEQLASDYPDAELTASLKLALAACENKKKKKLPAEALIQEHLSNPSSRSNANQLICNDPTTQKKMKSVALITAQIFLEHGDLARALDALRYPAVADIAESPGGVATRMSWMAQLGDVTGALDLLHSVLHSSPTCLARAKPLLVWAVHYLTTAPQPQLHHTMSRTFIYEALSHFLQGIENDEKLGLHKDPVVTALLVLCLVHYDLPAAREKMAGIASFTASSTSVLTPALPSEAAIADLEAKQPSRVLLEELGYCRPSASEGDRSNVEVHAGAGGEKRAPCHARRKARPLRRPAKNMDGKLDPERWVSMPMRSYIKDLPGRRKKELKRHRAMEQEQIRRRAAEKKRAEAALPPSASAPAPVADAKEPL